jgi:hypothetical protein
MTPIELHVNSKSVVTDSPAALHLLRVLLMRPAEILLDKLSIWLPQRLSDPFETLREAALVRTSEVEAGSYSYPSFCAPRRKELHASAESDPELREEANSPSIFCVPYRSFIGLLMLNFRSNTTAITRQETNVNALATSIIEGTLAKIDSTAEQTRSINPTILPRDFNATTTLLEALLVLSAYWL